MKIAELDIFEVWSKIGGGPLRNGRGQALWRGGEGWNVSLNRDRGAWYDFGAARGGGLLDLVMVALARDRSSALTWLQQHCGLDPLRPLSPQERREWANRHRRAEEKAQRVMHWHVGLIRNLEQAKVDTYQGYVAHPGQQEERSWDDACRRLYQAQRLGGAALMAAYRNALEQDPTAVEEIIKAACEDVAHAELYTSLLVALLGVSAVREKRHDYGPRA